MTTVALVVLAVACLAVAVVGILYALVPDVVEARWDEISGWLGDWSDEAQRGEPYDWATDLRKLGRAKRAA